MSSKTGTTPTLASVSADSSAPALTPCPYCAEPIRPQALVCKHCQRDLYFFAPLQQRLARLEADAAAVDALTQRVAQLERALAGTPAATTASTPNPPVAALEAAETARPVEAQLPSGHWLHSLGLLLGCVLSLVAAFTLLSLVFDLKEIYLRVASLLIPVPFAFMHVARRQFRFWREGLIGLGVATLFVTVMTGIIAQLQQQPWAPQDLREWREVITYGSSIVFAYLTGALLARILAERSGQRSTGALASEAAKLLLSFSSKAGGRGDQIKTLATTVQSVVSNLVVISTSAAAIWTGIWKMLG